MTKRRPPNKQKRAYFLRRLSLVDDTQWFHDEGRRVWFEKSVWASGILGTFTAEQDAKVVMAVVLDTDVSYRDYLADVLPDSVSVEEFLQAVQRRMKNNRAGKQMARWQTRALLRGMRKQHAALEVGHGG